MAALLSQETISRTLIDATVRMAESVADELTRADGREIRLEESPDLPLALLLPVDGFSCDVVRGIPAGLVDFLSPFQSAGYCRLASQPTSIGLWTVYMHQFNVIYSIYFALMTFAHFLCALPLPIGPLTERHVIKDAAAGSANNQAAQKHQRHGTLHCRCEGSRSSELL
jgi:hypothetical protein